MAGVPRQFQVLSTQPELKIRYVDRIWEKIVIFLFFLPFFVLFSGHVWILLRGLYELLNLRFWQVTQIFSYDTGNLWRAPQFAFAIFLLGFASWYGLWGLLGITEIQASHDLITIRYRFLWLSRETSCSIRNIEYLYQRSNKGGEGEIYWELEIVTNQRSSRKAPSFSGWIAILISEKKLRQMRYKTIHLYSHPNPKPSQWLGSVLADFNKVRFQSREQSN